MKQFDSGMYGNQKTKDAFDGYVTEVANKEVEKLRMFVRDKLMELQEDAMDTAGYIIIIENGWLVKKCKDGKIEKLSPIDEYERK